MTEYVIVQKLREGDEQGFCMLIDRYGSYVSTIIANLSRGALQQEDIEELAADVFISVWNNSDKLQTNRSLKPYIAQIARNAAFSRLRRCRHETVPFDEDILVLSKSEQPDEIALRKEQLDIINEAVDSFTEPDREIFIRFYFYGEQAKALGEKLNLNGSTVKTKLRRCRQKIQSLFEKRGYTEERGYHNENNN